VVWIREELPTVEGSVYAGRLALADIWFTNPLVEVGRTSAY